MNLLAAVGLGGLNGTGPSGESKSEKIIDEILGFYVGLVDNVPDDQLSMIDVVDLGSQTAVYQVATSFFPYTNELLEVIHRVVVNRPEGVERRDFLEGLKRDPQQLVPAIHRALNQ